LANPKVVRDFLKKSLPTSIQSVVDLETLQPQKESFIDDKLRLQIADLLYSVTIGGKPGYIYLLLEHASRPDRLLPFRMLKYMTAVMDNHLTKTDTSILPVVYPLILYTGRQAFNYSLDLLDLFGEHKLLARDIYKSPYQLVDLSHASDEVLAEYHWFRVAALLGKHIHDLDILPFLKKIMEHLRELENNGELEYVELSLSYTVEAGRVSDKNEFVQTVAKGLAYVNKEKVMKTIAEMFKEEVIESGLVMELIKKDLAEEIKKDIFEKGIEKGIEKGAEKRARLIAKNMLAENIPLDLITKITGIPVEILKRFKH
jgi:predicted transposase/invertase (TIGR01784 family)